MLSLYVINSTRISPSCYVPNKAQQNILAQKLFLKTLEPMHLEHWERLTRGFHGYRLFMQVQPYVGTLDGRKKWDY